MAFKLTIAKGYEQGKEVVLQKDEASIGRTDDNDLVLTEIGVSRKHVRVFLKAGRHFAEDPGGHRTLLNGQPLSEARELRAGDLLALGPVVLLYEPLFPPAPEAPREAPPIERVETRVAPPEPGQAPGLHTQRALNTAGGKREFVPIDRAPTAPVPSAPVEDPSSRPDGKTDAHWSEAAAARPDGKTDAHWSDAAAARKDGRASPDGRTALHPARGAVDGATVAAGGEAAPAAGAVTPDGRTAQHPSPPGIAEGRTALHPAGGAASEGKTALHPSRTDNRAARDDGRHFPDGARSPARGTARADAAAGLLPDGPRSPARGTPRADAEPSSGDTAKLLPGGPRTPEPGTAQVGEPDTGKVEVGPAPEPPSGDTAKVFTARGPAGDPSTDSGRNGSLRDPKTDPTRGDPSREPKTDSGRNDSLRDPKTDPTRAQPPAPPIDREPTDPAKSSDPAGPLLPPLPRSLIARLKPGVSERSDTPALPAEPTITPAELPAPRSSGPKPRLADLPVPPPPRPSGPKPSHPSARASGPKPVPPDLSQILGPRPPSFIEDDRPTEARVETFRPQPPPPRTLLDARTLAAAGALLAALVIALGFVRWITHSGPDLGPQLLGPSVLEDSFGLGPDVKWPAAAGKRFTFDATPTARSVVVLHFDARDVGPAELELRLNGTALGLSPAAEATDREIELVLPREMLLPKGRNTLELRRDPKVDATWRISRLWLERVTLPEVADDQLLANALQYAARGREYLDRGSTAPDSLYQAWRAYRSVWLTLDPLSPRPPLYDEARAKYGAIGRTLDEKCAALLSAAARSLERRDGVGARESLDAVGRYFPSGEHRCHNLARQMLQQHGL